MVHGLFENPRWGTTKGFEIKLYYTNTIANLRILLLFLGLLPNMIFSVYIRPVVAKATCNTALTRNLLKI